MANKKKQFKLKRNSKIILLVMLALGVLVVAAGMIMVSPKQTVITKASEDNQCRKTAKACMYKCSFLTGGSKTKHSCQQQCIDAFTACQQSKTRTFAAGVKQSSLSCQQKCYIKRETCKSQCEICALPESKGCPLCPIRDEDKCKKACKKEYETCTSPCSASSSSESSSASSASSAF